MIDSALVVRDPNSDKTKRGRPVGTTDKNKKHFESAILSSKNEVVDIIKKEREHYKDTRLPVGTLSKVIKAVTPGPTSPLLKHEPEFVSVITQMACMQMALCPSECLALINSLIDGKQAQRDLVAFKK